MKSRGIYDRKGELFGYLVGTEIFDLDDTQKGYVRDGVIYAMNDERQFVIRGDALLLGQGRKHRVHRRRLPRGLGGRGQSGEEIELDAAAG